MPRRKLSQSQKVGGDRGAVSAGGVREGLGEEGAEEPWTPFPTPPAQGVRLPGIQDHGP